MHEDRLWQEKVSTGAVISDKQNVSKELPPLTHNNRIWELDFFRGIALVLMIYFHVIYDMKEIFGYKVNYESGLNFVIGKASAILFILISGISCSLSRNNFKRGMRVLVIALVITLTTWLYNPKFAILFGILHFLAICMMLSVYIVKLNQYLLLGVGTLILASGVLINQMRASFDYLFILGIISSEFASADYYPLIPWMGIFLYGVGIGKLVYRNKQSVFGFVMRNDVINFLGKRTLICYLIHQPVIIGILVLIKRFF